MRRAAALLLSIALAGCLSADLPPDAADALPEGGADAVVLHEVYAGSLVTAAAPLGLAASPDQAGAVEREWYVHEKTRALRLVLAADADLRMHVTPPGCHAASCVETVDTASGVAEFAVDAPESGNWHAHFVRKDPGAGEVAYELRVEKEVPRRAAEEVERFEGNVVAAGWGAGRISPDQLGEVYREFWVHEATALLTVEVHVDRDVSFVLGQSDGHRDRESEEAWPTKDGHLLLEFEEPHVGGWYFIVFHPADEPGVRRVAYEVTVTKDLG